MLVSAVDPIVVNEALSGVSAGLLAVVATMKLKFAFTVVLANAIGDVFSKAVDRTLRAPLEVLRMGVSVRPVIAPEQKKNCVCARLHAHIPPIVRTH